MQFSRISEQRAYDDLKALNLRFWAGALNLQGLYDLLQRSGYDYRECVLAEVFPDGGQAFAGIVVVPPRELLEFELDPEDPDAAALRPVPPPDLRRRPSAAEARSQRCLALRYFEELAGRENEERAG
jgi:hypothetical protein